MAGSVKVGDKVAASKDNPEYIVEGDKTGERAAHKASALEKVRSE